MISHPIKTDDQTIEVRVCTERDDIRDSLGLEFEYVQAAFYKDGAYLRFHDDAGNETTFELSDATDLIQAIQDLVDRVRHEQKILNQAEYEGA